MRTNRLTPELIKGLTAKVLGAAREALIWYPPTSLNPYWPSLSTFTRLLSVPPSFHLPPTFYLTVSLSLLPAVWFPLPCALFIELFINEDAEGPGERPKERKREKSARSRNDSRRGEKDSWSNDAGHEKEDVCVLYVFTSEWVGGHASSWAYQHIAGVGVTVGGNRCSLWFRGQTYPGRWGCSFS